MNNFNFNIQDILKFIPHRYPFILIDRVLDYKNDGFLLTLKNITANDPFLQGHFTECFVFPGVLILESIAQSAVILLLMKYPKYKKKSGFYCITGIDSARFKRFVIPGDQLLIQITFIKERRNMFFLNGIVFSNHNVICSAKIICAYISNFSAVLNKL
ncbi:3-hydroxyacyl-ACP dehydratase FabZ [Buchnera aphidicola]|uniref:3-hydroxyacyl-ACP dehydratase FabZ n=1 Tax=Buchnera aphidicola TaxID=9 RepID=UPI0034644876